MEDEEGLTASEEALLIRTVLENQYIPQIPTSKQAEFLVLNCIEAFYGGAGGGGKSSALLIAALQYSEIPGYSALILRRSYPDLWLPGALMERSQEWLQPSAATWHGQEHIWRFPTGSTLAFGYLQHEKDKYRYASAEFQYIGFDEMTQFTESQYRFLFSRLRRLKDVNIPLRVRTASNPGGIGHEWVKQRFLVEGESKGRVFIPARLDDNPFIDQESYRRSLMNLDPIDRQRILNGDWTARHEGGMFKREWFPIVGACPNNCKLARFWDLAASEAKPGKDPDYTVGVLLAKSFDERYFIVNIVRARTTPRGVENLIKQTAQIDEPDTEIGIEQEPGASGVNTIDYYIRRVLPGYAVRGYKTTGSKETRAAPISSQAEAGNISLVKGPWINDFLDEAEAFPHGAHDDQIDGLSGSFNMLIGFQPRPNQFKMDSIPRQDPFAGIYDLTTDEQDPFANML